MLDIQLFDGPYGAIPKSWSHVAPSIVIFRSPVVPGHKKSRQLGGWDHNNDCTIF